MRTIVLVIGCLLLPVFNSFADDSPLFDQLQQALYNRDMQAVLALVVPDPEIQARQKRFIEGFFSFSYEKAVIRLSEQKDNRMIIHLFLQSRTQARFESWVLRLEERQNGNLIQKCDVINAVGGLYRLEMSDRPMTIRNLTYAHADSVIRFVDGLLFPIEGGGDIIGFFFMGNATFEFEPKDPTERQQVTLFSGQPRLETTIESLYMRSSPETFTRLLDGLSVSQPRVNEQLYQKASGLINKFDRDVYSVKLPFTDELWFAQMEENALYIEMRTPLGTLLYQHSPGETDDILVGQKDKDQIISLYNGSGAYNLQSESADFTVQSYKMKICFQPASTHLSSVTEVRLKSAKETTTVIFRLNPELRVSQIKSSQGYLLYFQEKQTSNLHLIFNEPVKAGEEIRLEFYYQGKIAPENRRSEAMAMQTTGESDFFLPPTFLYSNHSTWYPQLVSRPYSGVEVSITVPQSYAAVTNGMQTGIETIDGNVTYSYLCRLPAKYFSLFVGRLDSHFRKESVVPIDVYYVSLDRVAAEEYSKAADKILRFYSDYFGRYPYQNLALVLRPVHEPGGHAPATVAIVNRVFKFFQKRFAPDPLHIPEYPHFLLAHEIAHQWWGQTVGWRTYRDQWLSEGFAQFAAWEYMKAEHGEEAWKKLGRIFYNWIEDKTYAGPVILGARLGHIKEDPQAFSALLYNKGAYTLNMLKNWMGEEQFSKCLAEFYNAYQFKRVGVEEFTAIAQKYSNDDLGPFFQQWLYGWDIPELKWTQRIDGTPENPVLKIHFQQQQAALYRLKVPLEIRGAKGEVYNALARLDQADQEISISLPFMPVSVDVDPLRENLIRMPEPRKRK